LNGAIYSLLDPYTYTKGQIKIHQGKYKCVVGDKSTEELALSFGVSNLLL